MSPAFSTIEVSPSCKLSRKRGGRITAGADRAYDTRDFVSTVRELGVTPHVARRQNGAIDERTSRHPGYAISLKALAGGKTVRMAEADWPSEKAETTRPGEGGLVVRVQGALDANLCRLQLDPHPETAGAEHPKQLAQSSAARYQ